ncbi:MAG: hypothetical protein ABI810_19250 [Sphingomonas bacterium]
MLVVIQQLRSCGRFLLMDEPFSELDPINQDEAIELIDGAASQDDLNKVSWVLLPPSSSRETFSLHSRTRGSPASGC